MIFIYGTRVSSDNISGFFFHSFKTLILWVVRGVKEQKMAQNEKKNLSVTLHMPGTMHQMIAIYGTLVQNDEICRYVFNFFKILIFWIVCGVKGQKMAKNDIKFCLSGSISQEPYII